MSNLSRMQFASWRPARGEHVQAQLPLFPGHRFTELPMVEEQIAPVMDPISPAHARSMNKAPTGATRPIETVWRGMSHDEWRQASERGYVRSDERTCISPGWEGTNAAVDRSSAEYYRDAPGRNGGVLARIDVHPDDGWFLTDADSYARTRKPIPMHRVHLED